MHEQWVTVIELRLAWDGDNPSVPGDHASGQHPMKSQTLVVN